MTDDDKDATEEPNYRLSFQASPARAPEAEDPQAGEPDLNSRVKAAFKAGDKPAVYGWTREFVKDMMAEKTSARPRASDILGGRFK